MSLTGLAATLIGAVALGTARGTALADTVLPSPVAASPADDTAVPDDFASREAWAADRRKRITLAGTARSNEIRAQLANVEQETRNAISGVDAAIISKAEAQHAAIMRDWFEATAGMVERYLASGARDDSEALRVVFVEFNDRCRRELNEDFRAKNLAWLFADARDTHCTFGDYSNHGVTLVTALANAASVSPFTFADALRTYALANEEWAGKSLKYHHTSAQSARARAADRSCATHRRAAIAVERAARESKTEDNAQFRSTYVRPVVATIPRPASDRIAVEPMPDPQSRAAARAMPTDDEAIAMMDRL